MKHTVLCVDDDVDDLMLLREVLQEIYTSHAIEEKHNGKEALAYLESKKENKSLPCLIILDINMPVMDGKETLVRLKEDKELQRIPVVVFTTSNSKVDQLFCDKYNVPMVTKPLHFGELKEIVEGMLCNCIDKGN
jgi:CheY-like chemotaxis protein